MRVTIKARQLRQRVSGPLGLRGEGPFWRNPKRDARGETWSTTSSRRDATRRGDGKGEDEGSSNGLRGKRPLIAF